jgi:hypothetical protein
MRLERNNTKRRVGCCIAGQFNHRLVADMDAVKIANGRGRAAVLWSHKLVVSNDPHGVWVNAVRQGCKG